MVRAGLVAEEGGRPVGAVATDPAGSVPLLLVDPAHQRRGVGTRLLDEALRQLRALGVETVRLGSGGEDAIWPGVPDDPLGAVRFFEATGWRWHEAVIDLVRDLRDYRGDPNMYERAARAGVPIAPCGEQDRERVLAFEAETFPSWLRWFQRGDASVLAARDASGRLLGTLLYAGPGPVSVFDPMLGPMAGTIACVGVAGEAQGQGIGSAMVTRASELPRDAAPHVPHRLDHPRGVLRPGRLRALAALSHVRPIAQRTAQGVGPGKSRSGSAGPSGHRRDACRYGQGCQPEFSVSCVATKPSTRRLASSAWSWGRLWPAPRMISASRSGMSEEVRARTWRASCSSLFSPSRSRVGMLTDRSCSSDGVDSLGSRNRYFR